MVQVNTLNKIRKRWCLCSDFSCWHNVGLKFKLVVSKEDKWSREWPLRTCAFPCKVGSEGAKNTWGVRASALEKRGYFETGLTVEQVEKIGNWNKPKSAPQYHKLSRFSIVKEGKQTEITLLVSIPSPLACSYYTQLRYPSHWA